MTQAIATALVEVKTCATCPYFDNFNESNGRGWCRLFDHYARKHHEQTNDCVLRSETETPTRKNSLFRVYDQVEIKSSISYPPVLYSVIAYKLVESESPAYWQYEISNGEQTFYKQEKDLVFALENQVIEPVQAFPTEEIVDEADKPRSEYQVGKLVKVIDTSEHHSEWAIFEVVECIYNRERHRSTEAYLSETDWYYSISSLDGVTNLFVSEIEICDSDMSHNICTKDIF